MLAKLRERRERKRQQIETRLAIVDAVYGRLDGEDSAESDERMASLLDIDLPPELIEAVETSRNDPITNDVLIQLLEAQLKEAMSIISAQNEMLSEITQVTVAARAFIELLSSQHHKTGEGLFRLNGVDANDPLGQTLQFRYADLAAALNNVGRPVAPKLTEGTVH